MEKLLNVIQSNGWWWKILIWSFDIWWTFQMGLTKARNWQAKRWPLSGERQRFKTFFSWEKLRFSCWEHFFQNKLFERTFSDRCFKIFAYFKFQVFHFPGSSTALLIGQKRLTRDFPAFLSVLNLHVRHNSCLNINILYMLYVINMYVLYVIMGANI